MSVLIKGAEIPKSCFKCKFPRACQAIIRRIDEMYRAELFPQDHRHSDCPLIEVPESHGRLIDVDKLMKRMWDETDCMISVPATFVRDAPTIIPASEE